MHDIAIKHLISPFLFMPSSQTQKKQAPRKCDDDCEMAPECAFICNHAFGRNATKKRHSKGHNVKKTRRNKK